MGEARVDIPPELLAMLRDAASFPKSQLLYAIRQALLPTILFGGISWATIHHLFWPVYCGGKLIREPRLSADWFALAIFIAALCVVAAARGAYRAGAKSWVYRKARAVAIRADLDCNCAIERVLNIGERHRLVSDEDEIQLLVVPVSADRTSVHGVAADQIDQDFVLKSNLRILELPHSHSIIDARLSGDPVAAATSKHFIGSRLGEHLDSGHWTGLGVVLDLPFDTVVEMLDQRAPGPFRRLGSFLDALRPTRRSRADPVAP